MLTFKKNNTPKPPRSTSDDLRRALVRSLELLMELARATDLPVEEKVRLRRLKMAAAQARGEVEMGAVAMDVQGLDLEAAQDDSVSVDAVVAGAAGAFEQAFEATAMPGFTTDIRQMAAVGAPNPLPPALVELRGEATRLAGAVRFLRGRGDMLAGTTNELAGVLTQLTQDRPEVLGRLEATEKSLESAESIDDLELLREQLLCDARVLVADAKDRASQNAETQELLALHRAHKELLECHIKDVDAALTSDALTGLGNREALEDFVRSDAKSSDTTTVCVLEIDALASLRAAGLSVSDSVVRQFAAILRGELSDDEAAFRIDGGAFVTLVQQGQRDAKERMRSFAARVAESPIRVHGSDVSITTSIGLSEWKAGTAFREVLATADQRREKAQKRGGGVL